MAALLILWTVPWAPAAAGGITVETTSGRRYSGVIDSATDAQQLVLRLDASRCYVRRFFGWDALVRAWADEEELSVAELKVRAMTLGTSPQSAWPAADEPPKVDEPHAGILQPSAPAFIAVDATVANWNRDVLPDGLLLDLDVYDAAGQRIAAEGTLSVQLVGFRYGLGGGNRRFPVLGRWVYRVSLADFGPSGARYRLPFQALHPEEALDLSANGMVHAVLAVPGAGTFEAADNLLTIRRYAPLREELFEEQGTRYFPFEGTGRGRRLGQ